ncbi:GGDEF domain-containing protein [Frateuria aurantia]|uniref:diguanylate cyclase n=1 Tax=Frateuria aurantia (strain ATCC 33424 / DSM 6220 / KCTC 2777 / LMG 1558 / NBRC 3245 / NCIMB 13370) TaxID=767434 RepID=H8L6F0_FRAAD|nr:GGDEF domain-containing protein [Frateuria aurantia]AFC86827.1 diguanylate cyclase (GGDEF) domain-containing protein [Frateuria aurantia DSM 6220]
MDAPMHEQGMGALPVLLFVTGLVCASGFSLILRTLSDEKAYRYWVASLWIGLFSIMVVMFFPVHRPFPVLLAGHLALAASQVLLVAGVLHYCGRRVNALILIAPACLYIVLQVILYLYGYRLLPRIALYGFAVAVWDIWVIGLLLPGTRGGDIYGRRIAIIVIAGHALMHLLEVLYLLPAFSWRRPQGLADSVAIYYISIVMTLAKCFALLAMVVEKLINELRRAAEIDGMTGLLNRSALISRGAEGLAGARAKDLPFGALFIDIDHFKSINDDRGHHVGDQILKWFSSALKDVVHGKQDLCGRYGGEEFVCFLPGSDVLSCMTLGNRLRLHLASHPANAAAEGLDVTVSIGVAMDDGHSDLIRLIKLADTALYAAKNTGRDRVVLAEDQEPGIPKRRAGRC